VTDEPTLRDLINWVLEIRLSVFLGWVIFLCLAGPYILFGLWTLWQLLVVGTVKEIRSDIARSRERRMTRPSLAFRLGAWVRRVRKKSADTDS
jgi:hypothetical protein